MSEPPFGIVTFLFTDIAGSTRLWEADPRAMGAALARHDAIVREAIGAHGGTVFKTVGDAFCAAFALPAAAVAAAVAAQRALAAEAWRTRDPIRVRMALHAGTAEFRDGDYFGPPLNRVARLLAAGHGGQVLLSRAAAELVRDHLPADLSLRDLGEHRLRDLHHPDRIFQLIAPDLPADFPPPRTSEALLRNVPVHPTPLIGREQEIAAARVMLGLPTETGGRAPVAVSPPARLLTLTGPGGAGKTRLAIHLATAWSADFADGAAFVSLAALTDPDLVLPEIADVFDLRDAGGGSTRDLVVDHLRDRQLLLVLDNFEQVTAAVPVVADLLAACPRLAVLATSRERLRLRGEQELPVPPLALPDPPSAWAIGVEAGADVPLPIDEVLRAEAVRLFVERARSVKPDFAVEAGNAAAVVEICRRLDGLPLAIELAAARVRLLPPKTLLGRLDRRLDLLSGGPRDLPARQQTIRDAIAWSHDLLSPEERAVFRRLAICAGGCTLEAAEAVAEEVNSGKSTPSVLDLVESLADKSLLRIELDAEDEPRVAMLETIRDFGLERLQASGEAEAIGRRHAALFLALAETAEPRLDGPEQTRWLDRLERDEANLRAALAWLRDRGETEAALRLGGAMWRFWWLRGHVDEGRAALDQLLRRPEPVAPAVRAKALNGAGVLAESQGDYDVAAALHEESLAIFRALGDARGTAWSLNNLGVVATHQGDYDRAKRLLDENLAVAEAAGDTAGVAMALMDLGQLADRQGDPEQATALYARSLDRFRALGNQSHIARALNNLGALALDRGDYEQARALLTESLDLLRGVGDRQGVARTLNNLGDAARQLGEADRATALYRESLALAREIGDKLVRAVALESLAELSRRDGQVARADHLYRDALASYLAMGDWVGVAACLAGLAQDAAAGGSAAAAARLFGAAAAIRAAHDLPPPDAADEARALASARAALGAAAFAEAWAAGERSPPERLVAEVVPLLIGR